MTAPPTARRATLAHAGLAADLRVALMRTVRRLRAEKSDDGITDGQYAVLAVLDRAGPATPRELAQAEHVRPPSMTRTVTALAETGLVVRTDHPDDGRAVLVSLTPAGATVVRETRRRRDAWLAQRLARLEPAERALLADAAVVLRKVMGDAS